MSELAMFPSPSSEGDVPSKQSIVQEDHVSKYYQWLDGTRAAEANERAKWAGHPDVKDKSLLTPKQPWEEEWHSDYERGQVWTGAQIIDMNKSNQTFSPAALAVVSSYEHAKFFDDIKCDYLGDSDRMGHFREISPEHNFTPFDVQFNYNRGVLNSYTESGTVIHIRETLDPEAKARNQRLFIVAINLMNMEIQRLYTDDKPRIESLNNAEKQYSEIMPLTRRTLSRVESYFPLEGDHPLQPHLQQLFENHTIKNQPQLKKAVNGTWQYKPEGPSEFSHLHPIVKLDRERHLLGMIATSTGGHVIDRGVIAQSFTRQELA